MSPDTARHVDVRLLKPYLLLRAGDVMIVDPETARRMIATGIALYAPAGGSEGDWKQRLQTKAHPAPPDAPARAATRHQDQP